MADSDDTTVLNTLITTTIDSVRGYRDAAEDAEGTHAQLFREMAQEREQVVTGLQQAVRSLGGTPEDDGSLKGAAHRNFMNLKDLIVSRDEKAIINEVERGEDYLKGKYDTALKEANLGAQARSAIDTAYASVRKGHDRVSAIKHAMT